MYLAKKKTWPAVVEKRRLHALLFSLFVFVLFNGAAFAQTQTIDFEDLSEGDVVSTVFADGGFGPVSVFGENEDDLAINAAVVFDSNCPGGCSGEDPDLGSPNSDFGGPGLDDDGDPMTGGNDGSPFQNDMELGNILIVHELLDEIADEHVDDPDDATGSTSIVITFPEPVTVYSFTMIDREMNETQNVELLGEGDVSLGMFDTPATGNNGVGVVNTDAGAEGSGTAGVVKLVMNHVGSGGLDNIVFQPPPPPPPPGDDCTFTQGFWKNHEEAWPVDQLDLGSVTYNQDELLEILNTPPRGDKTLILAHQLIAAKLNVANGADDSALDGAIADADDWLADNGGVGSGARDWNGGESIKNTLDSYNNGAIGPGHCDDSGDEPNAENLFRDARRIPEIVSLDGNHPNPFNPQTVITFSLDETAYVRLAVYDMLGRELEVLIDGSLPEGQYSATFDAVNLPSGTYLYRLETPEGTLTNKMVLAK